MIKLELGHRLSPSLPIYFQIDHHYPSLEPSLDSIQPNADKATGIEKYRIARIVDEDQSVENYTKDDIMQSAFVFALGHINSDLSMYCVLYVSIQDSLGYSRRDMGERERSR